MNLKQRLEKAGATPGKLALIGVLSLVLIGVVVGQLPEAAQTTTEPTPGEPPQQLTKTNQTDTGDSNNQDQQQPIRPWPESNLAATLANNPFAEPSWARAGELDAESIAATPAGVPGELAELQEQGASIVVIGAGRKLAEIGDQRLYVGDVLEGYRVTDITTQGILLDKLE